MGPVRSTMAVRTTRNPAVENPEAGSKADYTTLQDALNGVEPFTTIYLAEGVYSCPDPITKPGIIV